MGNAVSGITKRNSGQYVGVFQLWPHQHPGPIFLLGLNSENDVLAYSFFRKKNVLCKKPDKNTLIHYTILTKILVPQTLSMPHVSVSMGMCVGWYDSYVKLLATNSTIFSGPVLHFSQSQVNKQYLHVFTIIPGWVSKFAYFCKNEFF